MPRLPIASSAAFLVTIALSVTVTSGATRPALGAPEGSTVTTASAASDRGGAERVRYAAVATPVIGDVEPLRRGVTIRWRIHVARHPVIRRFLVFIAGARAVRVYAIGPKARAATLGGLRPNTKYAVSIAAVTASGRGRPSAPQTFQTTS